MSVHHQPVMLKEVIKLLHPQPGEIWVDATIGGGGHAEEILKRVGSDGFLIGMDKDGEAIRVASEKLREYKNVRLFQGNFADVKSFLDAVGVEKVDGVVFDLGVSSMQIESVERGFSFALDGPLDMRMDRSRPISAKDVVNTLSEEELKEIFFKYGEERYSSIIAKEILNYRKRKKIETTMELVEIVRKALPMYIQRRMGKHPARRVFQALRIYVNDEISSLDKGIRSAIDCLVVGGRIGVITFHSIEDRVVKAIFKEMKDEKILSLLNKRVIKPSAEEVNLNKRARSAKLRGAVKVGAGSGS